MYKATGGQTPQFFERGGSATSFVTEKSSKFPKKKWAKILGASTLALFMGVGTLLGVLVAPASAAQARVGGGEKNLSTTSPLGIDPENDPVVYTTDYGLEIKYANSLTLFGGYTYFTVGDVNWVIIGYDPSMSALVGEFSGEIGSNVDPIQGDNKLSSTLDKSDAGIAILLDNFAISNLAKPNDEIGDGCVLCFAEIRIDDGTGVKFNNSTSSNNYDGSQLKEYIDKYYEDNLTSLRIVQKKLTTKYYNNATSSLDVHVFPLANSNTETFYFGNYLTQGDDYMVVPGDWCWWLRSGVSSSNSYAAYIHPDGLIYNNYSYFAYYVNRLGAVRPAFVLQLM